MLKIKLARFGKRNQPHFRIVINEARDKRDGSYVEMIGYYTPSQTPKLLELDIKKYDAWLVKGAQPTETVAYLYKVAKSGKGFPVKKSKLSKKQVVKKTGEKEEKKGETKADEVKKEVIKEVAVMEESAKVEENKEKVVVATKEKKIEEETDKKTSKETQT